MSHDYYLMVHYCHYYLMVPEGTNKAASFPNILLARCSSSTLNIKIHTIWFSNDNNYSYRESFGYFLLTIDCRIFFIDIITNNCIHHLFSHLKSWLCNCVTPEVNYICLSGKRKTFYYVVLYPTSLWHKIKPFMCNRDFKKTMLIKAINHHMYILTAYIGLSFTSLAASW